MASEPLRVAYERLIGHESFSDSHVSLDRDTRANEYVQIQPGWIDGAGLSFVVALARELELSLALDGSSDTLRLEEHSSDVVQGVEVVRAVLREGESDDD